MGDKCFVCKCKRLWAKLIGGDGKEDESDEDLDSLFGNFSSSWIFMLIQQGLMSQSLI